MGLGILPPPGVAPAKAPLVQDFTTSGTWTKPAGARYVLFEGVGAGGCGVSNGSGGAYARMLFMASELAATESVTVGAGGSFAASDQRGGSTVFHGMTAFGGWKGQAPGRGLPGGVSIATGSSLALTLDGQFDGGSIAPSAVGGRGGNSAFGAGGATGQSGFLGGQGGTSAGLFGALKAGNGGSDGLPPTAPGGGGSSLGSQDGARGAARITTYF